MSDSESEDVPAKKKKGKVNKHLHTREMEKLARMRGDEFVTKEGTLVEAKITGPDCQCHKVCMTFHLKIGILFCNQDLNQLTCLKGCCLRYTL